MGLQKCGLNLNRMGKELQPHGTRDFPCAGFDGHYTNVPEDIIPWHWHEEIEMVYVKNGAMKFQIPNKSFQLEKGDFITVNANVCHYAAADYPTELYSLVFDPLLIAGNKESIFAQKYLLPLISCPSFYGYFIKASADDKVTDAFIDAFNGLGHGATGTITALKKCLITFTAAFQTI